MNALVFEIHSIEPLLFMQTGAGDPNSASTQAYIPGSAIRGVLVSKYLSGKRIDATEPNFQKLFLSAETRFLNGYPQSSGSDRQLPTPLSWRASSDYHPDMIFDFAFFTPKTKEEKVTKWKVLQNRFPFCALYNSDESPGAELWDLAAHTQVSIHIARGNRQQLTNAESSVFRYQSLASGLKFKSAILSNNIADLKLLKDLLLKNHSLRIGKSNQAGYGLVEIKAVEIIEGWQEYTKAEIPPKDIVVTLLSDAVLRDPLTGEFTADLGKILNEPVIWSATRLEIGGGYNRTAGLPISQYYAVPAGSVYRFKSNPELVNLLEKLEETGVGDKTVEGFGRIAVNWNCEDQISRLSEPSKDKLLTVKLNAEGSELASLMIKRLTRSRLDLNLARKMNGLVLSNPPHNSQLSRLRTAVRHGLAQNSTEPILKHLSGLKSAGRQQLERSKIGDTSKSLLTWLKDAGENTVSFFETELELKAGQLPEMAGITFDQKELATEYTLRLVDGVMRKTAKSGGDK